MHERTKALMISKAVKDRVWARDGGKCVWCHSTEAQPNAHYISRAQGGLGIEENVLTLCPECHRRYDHTVDRHIMRPIFERYLKNKYPGWDEENLYYRKGGNYA